MVDGLRRSLNGHRCHDVGLRERLGHLVYEPEPQSYISGRCGCREFSNCSRKFASWFHCCGSDLKSCKLDCVLCKDELVWIQGDSVRSAPAQPCSLQSREMPVQCLRTTVGCRPHISFCLAHLQLLSQNVQGTRHLALCTPGGRSGNGTVPKA